MDTLAVKEIGLAEVAKALRMLPAALERQLALLGWGIVMNEAEWLAFAQEFDSGLPNLKSRVSKGNLGLDEPLMHWKHLEAAFRSLIQELACAPPENARPPKDRLDGSIYVLHDGVTGLSKIGCTAGSGQRQRSQMASHGNVLVNLVNAQVADMRAAEAQCHEHFKAYRRNGEWFDAPIDEILRYIAAEVEWKTIDRENDARLAHYFAACRVGDIKAAKEAIWGPNHPCAEPPTSIVVRITE